MVMRVLLVAVLWVAISAVMLFASAEDRNRGAAWFWAVSFAVSSLVAAYCFGRLIWKGEVA